MALYHHDLYQKTDARLEITLRNQLRKEQVHC